MLNTKVGIYRYTSFPNNDGSISFLLCVFIQFVMFRVLD